MLSRCAVLGGFALLAVAACADEDAEPATSATVLDDDVITVASFDFPESVLIAEIYGQALEHEGFAVERALSLGPREFVGPAMRAGLVELVPEYAGSALTFASLGATAPSADLGATHAELERVLADVGVVALDSAPGQNANAFVVTRETAAAYGLDELSDLSAVAGQLTLGGPPECPARPLCQVGLRRLYGTTFADFVPLDVGGPATQQALRNGTVDVALLFTTDPTLDDYVVLTDDRQLQPAENVTPLVRAEVIERWGASVVDVIDGVSASLDTRALRELNAADAAEPGSVDAAAIARGWLRTAGLS